MTSDDNGLGGLVERYPPRGGVMGFQDRPMVRTVLLTFAGAVVGVIPGLFVALFTDFWPALLIGAIAGAIVAYRWASRLNFDAAVTEARRHDGGVVLVDPRGAHALRWDEVASIEGRHTQAVLGTGVAGVGDVKGVTEHTYLLRGRDGTGYWLDDRITNVVALVQAITQASGVGITPMR